MIGSNFTGKLKKVGGREVEGEREERERERKSGEGGGEKGGERVREKERDRETVYHTHFSPWYYHFYTKTILNLHAATTWQ